jgi:hypothetical protein
VVCASKSGAVSPICSAIVALLERGRAKGIPSAAAGRKPAAPIVRTASHNPEKGGGLVSTLHERERSGLGSWGRTRWFVVLGIVVAVIVGIVLIVMLTGGGGSGGGGGY